MAADNKDVQLSLSVKTDGVGAISALAKQVEALAKEGTEAAPAFEHLAGELRQIGAQQEALATFVELRRGVATLAGEMEQAAAAVDKLGAQLPEASAATQAFADKQSRARQEVDATDTALKAAQAELKGLRDSYDAAGKRTDEYRNAAQALRATVAGLKAELQQKKAAASEAGKAASEAAKAEKQLTGEYNAAINSAKAVSGELGRKNRALAESRTALGAAGLATDDLSGSQQALRKALDTTVEHVDRQAASLRASRDAAAQKATSDRQAAEASAAAARAAVAEQDRLDAIVSRNRTKQMLDAREQLEVEKQVYVQSVNAARAAESAKVAAAAKTAQAQKELRAAAQAAQQAFDDAFAKTGVRSAQAIEKEIRDVVAALYKLKNDATITGKDFDRAFAGAQQRVAALERELRTVPGHISMADRAAQGLRSTFGQLAAAYGAIELGKKFIDANTQIEALRRGLTILTGSTAEAGKQIEFLRRTADNSGVAIGEITDSYLRLAASASEAGIPMERVQGIFGAVARAAGQLGLNSQQANRAIEALGQMASKGVVSMEEMRQQLGDALPGALAQAARGLGVTTARLVDMIERGQVLTEDMFPALESALLQSLAKGTDQVQGFQASWNRMKNALTETSQFVGDSGFMAGLTTAVTGASVALRGMVGAFTLVGKSIGITAGAIATFDVKKPAESFRRWKEAIAETEAELTKAYKTSVDGGQAATTASGQVGAAVEKAGQQATAGAAGMQANAVATAASASAALEAAAAQQKAGAATAAAGAQAGAATTQWYSILAAYTQQIKAKESDITTTTNLANAKKMEVEAANRIAQVSGDEAEIRRVAAAGAEAHAVAIAKNTAARQAELGTLQQQIVDLRAEGEATGTLTSQKQELLKKLETLVEKKKSEVEQSQQSAEAAHAEAAEKQILAQVYADNSEKLDQFKKAADAAAEAYRSMVIELAAGRATQEAVNSAAERAAKAQRLYRDAIDDVAAAAKRKIEAIRNDSSLTEQSLRIDQQKARTSEMIAERYGNETIAMYAKIRGKEIEIKIVEANIKAALAEADAIIASAQAERDALSLSDPLYAAKKAEIEARLANAEAKRLEAAAGKETIAQIREEIALIRQRNNEADRKPGTDTKPGTSAGGGGSGGGAGTRATNLAPVDKIFSILDKRDKGLLTAADLPELEEAMRQMQTMSSLATRAGGLNSNTAGYEIGLQQARDVILTAMEAEKRGAARGAGGTATPSGGAAGGGGGGAYHVNINLGRKSTSIATNSQADANNLVTMLRELSDAAERAT